MKNPLKQILALSAALFACAVSAFAQEAPAKIPNIQIDKVDFKQVSMPNADQKYKWGQTLIEFKVQPSADGYLSGSFLNNVKMTLTLMYKRTAASLSGDGMTSSRARGQKGKAAVEKAVEDAGGDASAKFTSYRASVRFAALKVGDGKKAYAFYIPGEIIERDKEVTSGNAKPAYYYIEFEYNDMVISPFDAAGKFRSKYMDCPNAASLGANFVINPNSKDAAQNFEMVRGWADATISDTKGLLVPAYLTPAGSGVVSGAPSVVREDVLQ